MSEAAAKPLQRRAAALPTERRSATQVAFFGAVFDRFFRRHMNALRVARWGEPDLGTTTGPLIVYSNHPSWWDAIVYGLATREFFGSREGYAPIGAEMLRKYGFFGRIGAYGVELDSPRGGAAFLRASTDILARPNSLIWIAAQGRFVDARARPLGLKPGTARLAEIAPGATFLPMAIEYAFWDERGAEALLAFGRPVLGAELAAIPRGERLARLEQDLSATMDRLALDVQARDPERFRPLMQGRSGVGGIYDAWRHLSAWLRGRHFDPAHGSRAT